MRKQRGYVEIVSLLLAALLLIGLFVAVVMFFENWACKSKWERSNMAVSWGPIQGCLVNLPDGRWLPEERIREIDISRAPQRKADEVPR